MTKEEYEVREHMLKDKCPICKTRFKLKEKIVLVSLQEPKGPYFITSMALPIHTKCYYIEK